MFVSVIDSGKEFDQLSAHSWKLPRVDICFKMFVAIAANIWDIIKLVTCPDLRSYTY